MSKLAALVLAAVLATAAPASADPASEIRALYQDFVTAQNAHDLAAVRRLFVPSPQFLWISDGMAFWGPDTVLSRMALFQQAEVWHVDPALDQSVAVEVSSGTAYLHLPLTLTIGSAAAPEEFRFLVDVLCAQTNDGWRIAALFTTTRHSGPGDR